MYGFTIIVEVDSTKVKLRVWDKTGNENISYNAKGFYGGSHAIMLAFDLTN